MPNFLEADDTLFKKSLLLPDLQDVLGGEGGDRPPSSHGSKINMSPTILTPSQKQEAEQCKFIIPEPGRCVKTVDKKSKEKVFINICHSDKVPEPILNFTDEQLATLLSDGTDDQVDDVRIPISIGEKRMDADKGGIACQVYDVIVNNKFYKEKILNSELYWTFLCVVSMEALDEKYKLELERSKYVVMKNKSCHGKIQPQFVRSKPAIREVSSTAYDPKDPKAGSSVSSKKPLIQVVSERTHEEPKPKIQVVSEAEQKPTQNSNSVQAAEAEAEVKESNPDSKLDVKFFQTNTAGLGLVTTQLPGLKDMSKVTLTYEGDEIKIKSPVGQAHMKVPVNIDTESSRHEFSPAEHKLKIYLYFKKMDDKTLEDWKAHGYDIYAFEKEFGVNLTMR